MSPPAFLVIKLAAAGDVLLTTALTRALRQAQPDSYIGWICSEYAFPLLQGNPDLNEIMPVPTRGGGGMFFRQLLRFRRRGNVRVILAHRSRRLEALVRIAGCGDVISLRRVWDPRLHRLELQQRLLRLAGVAGPMSLRPRLELNAEERRTGQELWRGASGPRWAMAAGGARNPWSEMPNRRWPRERFLALARRAQQAGIALRWVGGSADAPDTSWLAHQLQAPATDCGGRLTLRQTAALLAHADLVIGNDSLPLVMADALERPALGLYGPTAGAGIHPHAQPFLQGMAGCGPCYDPARGVRGTAYRCPRARCMEAITAEQVWRLAGASQPPLTAPEAREVAIA